ncbi:hypothetical protein [Streptomyces yangpuensis]|uniref:hypothetical protein n=1 Tax=Streptomyces yangpuensis TaxID=1648182 RepID=UPI0036D0ACFA
MDQAVSDAVCRAAQQRLAGPEEELGEDAEAMAPGWSAGRLRGHSVGDILTAQRSTSGWWSVRCEWVRWWQWMCVSQDARDVPAHVARQ